MNDDRSRPVWSSLQDRALHDRAMELRRLYAELREEMRTRWHRDMPLEELLFDRWERAAELGFGEQTSIYHNSYVYGEVKVGKSTWIGPFCLLDGSGGLSIGDHCSISAGVQIYTHDTVKWALSSGRQPYERAPVRIGDASYVGAMAVVVKGVEVGDHCVVGAHSLVNRSVPPFTAVAGVPARVIGRVDMDESGEPRIVRTPDARDT